MGRKSTTGGVTPRGPWIKVTFQWRLQRRRETLKLAPTSPNLKHARRLRQEIVQKIHHGTFDYAAYFPESKYAEKPAPKPTVRESARPISRR